MTSQTLSLSSGHRSKLRFVHICTLRIRGVGVRKYCSEDAKTFRVKKRRREDVTVPAKARRREDVNDANRINEFFWQRRQDSKA